MQWLQNILFVSSFKIVEVYIKCEIVVSHKIITIACVTIFHHRPLPNEYHTVVKWIIGVLRSEQNGYSFAGSIY